MSSSLRPSKISGRSSGVPFSLVFEYVPCRSGSPQGVRGGVHFLLTAVVGALPVWALSGVVISVAVRKSTTERCLIETSLQVACDPIFQVYASQTVGLSDCALNLFFQKKAGCSKDTFLPATAAPFLETDLLAAP